MAKQTHITEQLVESYLCIDLGFRVRYTALNNIQKKKASLVLVSRVIGPLLPKKRVCKRVSLGGLLWALLWVCRMGVLGSMGVFWVHLRK